MKRFVKFLIKDFKTDFLFLRDVFNGKVFSGKSKYVKDFKKLKQEDSCVEKEKGFLASYWLFFLIVFAAFLMGFFVAGKVYQEKCNFFIYENFILPHEQDFGIGSVNPSFYENLNFSKDLSSFDFVS